MRESWSRFFVNKNIFVFSVRSVVLFMFQLLCRRIEMSAVKLLRVQNNYCKYFHKFCVSLFLLLCCFHFCTCDCNLVKRAEDPEEIKTEERLLKMIKPLTGVKFQTKDENYTYYVTICDNAKGQTGNVSAVQVSKSNKTVALGKYNMTDIMSGTDWMLLTYYGGENYTSHCDKSERTTRIMIICDPDNIAGEFRILEERIRKDASYCYYLFELGSSTACSVDLKNPETKGLSSGSVFCIIFFTVCGLYLLMGFLYQRIVIGAKGLEQIPNYSFWREFGNLQADGCEYFCRCGPRQESQAYRGIDDRLRADDERDDQLLNM